VISFLRRLACGTGIALGRHAAKESLRHPTSRGRVQPIRQIGARYLRGPEEVSHLVGFPAGDKQKLPMRLRWLANRHTPIAG